MFDSIYLDVDCPHCGKKHEVEAQTKDLDCELFVWREGDHIGSGTQYWNITSLYCIASCDANKVSIKDMNPKPKTLEEYANMSGTSEFFNLEVYVDDCVITGEYKII